MIDFEALEHPVAGLGEGPVWDYRSGRFLWVDAFSGGYYTLDRRSAAGDEPDLTATGHTGGSGAEGAPDPRHHHIGAFTIGIALCGYAGDACVVTEADGFRVRVPGTVVPSERARVTAEAKTECPWALVPPLAGSTAGADSHRFNDVAAIPGNILLAGVMPWAPDPAPRAPGAGALIAFDAGRRPHLVCSEVRLPNGIGYDPTLDVVYFTDSFRKTIYRIPLAVIGEIVAGARPPISLDALPPEVGVFVDSSDRPGVPDGLTVTSEGSVFSARWGGGCIDRYGADGALMRSNPVPMRQPSSLCFGGDAFSTVMITSATENIPEHRQGSFDGATILTDFGIRGLPEAVLAWECGES